MLWIFASFCFCFSSCCCFENMCVLGARGFNWCARSCAARRSHNGAWHGAGGQKGRGRSEMIEILVQLNHNLITAVNVTFIIRSWMSVFFVFVSIVCVCFTFVFFQLFCLVGIYSVNSSICYYVRTIIAVFLFCLLNVNNTFFYFFYFINGFQLLFFSWNCSFADLKICNSDLALFFKVLFPFFILLRLLVLFNDLVDFLLGCFKFLDLQEAFLLVNFFCLFFLYFIFFCCWCECVSVSFSLNIFLFLYFRFFSVGDFFCFISRSFILLFFLSS